MKKLITISIYILIFCAWGNAQDYALKNIPDTLLVNANAIVRHQEITFKQTDINNGTAKFTYVITVLNKSGNDFAEVVISQDRFRELKSFSGSIEDPKTGKVIKKFSKGDLITTAYSTQMASDDKYSLYEYQSVIYPYTIKYEYEIKFKNGIISYPAFQPMRGYYYAVEYAKHSIQIPAEMKIRHKALQLPDNGEPKIEKQNQLATYVWTLEKQNAIVKEAFSPSYRDIFPLVLIAPEKFCMEGQCGDMKDWNSLGSWIGKLHIGRDLISQQLKDKLIEMTSDAADDKEKIQRVYKYLQTTTRYVNVNLGIGGYQSIPAGNVEKSGFGDCKALSNYMKAMLSAIGIPSIYTVISMQWEDIYTDFASFTQMDHVILAVPQANDTIWLECTSPIEPFNYAHGKIEGHQALLITENGGELCRVRSFLEIGNNTSSSFHIIIDNNGNGKAKVHSIHKLKAYEDMQSFARFKSRDEQINYLANITNLSKVKITDLKLASNDSEMPDIQLFYDMDIEGFANKSGTRLFVPFSSLEVKITSTLRQGKSKRKQDIIVENGFLQADTLQINIPANYIIESLPKSSTFDSQFGNYSINVELSENNVLLLTQKLHLKKGRYPAAEYEKFKHFFQQIEKESSRRAVFKLKN